VRDVPLESGVEVPYARLDAAVLRRVVEEFVTRDGTDYGAAEKTLDQKVSDVTREIRSGRAALVFDGESLTMNVVQARTVETIMGDRSPKSKQRDQKQKDTARATDAAAAKTKQDSQSRTPLPNVKGRK
jgi:uncharacterized protein